MKDGIHSVANILLYYSHDEFLARLYSNLGFVPNVAHLHANLKVNLHGTAGDHIVLTLQPQFCFVLRFLCRLCMRRLLWHDLFHCPLTRTMLVHTLIVLPSFLTGLLLLYKCVMIEPILSALPPSSLSLILACTISTSRL